MKQPRVPVHRRFVPLGRVASSLVLVLGAVLITTLATWPSAKYLTTRLYWTLYSEDTGAGLWWPNAFVDALLRGENPLHATSLEWPVGAWAHVWNFGIPLFFAPVYHFARPIAANNLVAYAIAVLNALSCAWVARVATRSRTGALVGLFVGAASAYAWAEAGAGRQDQALWAPIALYLGAFLLLLREPDRWKNRLMTGGVMAFAGACYWFHAIFLMVGSALVVAYLAARGRLTGRQVKGVAVAAGVAVVFVAPFLVPVAMMLNHSTRELAVVAQQVTRLLPQQIDWSFSPACFGGLLTRGRADPSIHAPLLLLPASLYAAVRGNEDTRILGGVGLVAALLASGPVVTDFSGHPVIVSGHAIPLPTYFLDTLPGFHRLWWPHRWIVLAFPGLAAGTAWFVAHRRRPTAWVALIGAFLTIECAILLRISVAPRGTHWPKEHVPAVFDDLAREPYPSPILHLPAGVVAPIYLVWQPFHRQPIDQGLDWHIPGMVPNDYRDRIQRIPLVQRVERRTRGEPVTPPARWSPEDTSGFCYVLLNRDEVLDTQLEDAVTSLLGPAMFKDTDIVLWHIPGACEESSAQQ